MFSEFPHSNGGKFSRLSTEKPKHKNDKKERQKKKKSI